MTIGALGLNGRVATMSVERGTGGEVFRISVAQVLIA